MLKSIFSLFLGLFALSAFAATCPDPSKINPIPSGWKVFSGTYQAHKTYVFWYAYAWGGSLNNYAQIVCAYTADAGQTTYDLGTINGGPYSSFGENWTPCEHKKCCGSEGSLKVNQCVWN